MSAGENSEKYGLKLNLNAIIQRTVKSLEGFYTESLENEKYEKVEKNVLAYNFRSAEMYSNVRYMCISTYLDKSRRPEQLPLEKELKNLKILIGFVATVWCDKKPIYFISSIHVPQYRGISSIHVPPVSRFVCQQKRWSRNKSKSTSYTQH